MKKKVFREKHYGKEEIAKQVDEMLEITPVVKEEPKKRGRKKKND